MVGEDSGKHKKIGNTSIAYLFLPCAKFHKNSVCHGINGTYGVNRVY